jgi:hypothetical protein
MVSRLAKYLLLLLLFLAQFSSGADLDWPLKEKVSLSSIFCDYRSFHYHSGLDLRTGGKVGVRVYAPGDGHLYRTYTSFWGYGKALYMRLDDGRILVFGHLSGFDPEVEKRVFQAQVRQGSYHTDAYYLPGEVPIKKGQLIGYTGQTGSGGPHLHFEMRDENNHPINPLKNGYEIEDTLPPRFLNLAIRDLSTQTPWRDSGSCEVIPAYYKRLEERYELIKMPAASGRFGVEVNVIDRIYGAKDSYGVYALEFSLDDSLIFSERFDEISFETTRQQELFKDFGLRRQLATSQDDLDYHSYYNLYDLIHEPFRGVLDTEVQKVLHPGKHRGAVRAYDSNGNFSDLNFELLVDRPPEVVSLELAFRGNNSFSARAYVKAGEFAIWMVEFEIKRGQDWEYLGSLPGQEESAVYKIDWVEEFADTVCLRVCALDIWETRSPYLSRALVPDSLFAYTPSDAAWGSIITVEAGHGGREAKSIGPPGGIYQPDDGMVSVEFEPGSVRFGIIPECKTENVKAPPSGELVSPAYEFFPQSVPFIEKATLAFDLGRYQGERSKVGIYELEADDRFEFLGNQFDHDSSTISAKINYFATFVLLEDSEPPRISRLYPSSGSKVTNRTTRIFAQLRDELSGIVREEDIEVTLDGVWVPAEYDYETEELYYRVRHPLAYGRHRLVISATDACGNKTIRTSVFTIAESE